MKSFTLRNTRSTAKRAFTLAELVVVGAIVAVLAVALLPSFRTALDSTAAKQALTVLGQVKNAKEQFRAAVIAGGTDMPSGSDAETLDSYVPTLTDLAPFMKANGVQEGTVPTNDQVMAGTGKRVLSINALSTDPTCTPVVPATYQVK